jgi:tetratricopeptide (TPR) repeat protein
VAQDQLLPDHPECVVKKFSPPPNSPPRAMELAKQFFEKEAKVLYQLYRSLNHDRIPQILAYFEENQQFYLVENLIRGVDLEKELRQGCLDESQVIALLQDVLETLAFLHQHHVIHLDIKPANLIRRQSDQRVVLIDFGAVKELGSQATAIATGQMPHTTNVCITPGYAAPELLRRHPVYSSDLYALGMTAIQALTGRFPTEFSEDPQTEQVLWRSHAQVSPTLADILDQMIRPRYAERYTTATAVLRDLERLVPRTLLPAASAPAPVSTSARSQFSSKRSLLAPVVAIAAGLGVIGVAIIISQPCVLPGVCPPGDPTAANTALRRGNSLLNARDYDQALMVSDQALKLDPHNPYVALDAWALRGRALLGLEDYEGAIKAFDQALSYNPDPEMAATFWTRKGNGLAANNQLEEALNAYEQALKLKADLPIALSYQGVILARLGRMSEAIPRLDRARSLDPNSAEIWVNQGDFLLHYFKQPHESLKFYDQAIRLDPISAPAFTGRGDSLMGLNHYGEARRAYEEAIRVQPDYAAAWYGKGNALAQLQKPTEAIAAYDQAIELKPDYAEAKTARDRLR